MAVDADGDPLDAGDMLPQVADELSVLVGNRVAHGVRHVEHRGPRRDRHGEDLHQIGPIAPRGVLGREFHVLAEGLGQRDPVPDHLQRLGPGLLELVLQVDIRGSQEGVDPGMGGLLKGLPGPFDVAGDGPAEGRDGRPPAGAGDGLDGGEVIIRGHREAGLDDIHAQGIQLPSHQQLLVQVHAAAWRLFAVAKGGVEDGDPLSTHDSGTP